MGMGPGMGCPDEARQRIPVTLGVPAGVPSPVFISCCMRQAQPPPACRPTLRPTCGRRSMSSAPPPGPPAPPPGATLFLRSPPMSHTRTVWSREAEATRSSLGWNWAHMT